MGDHTNTDAAHAAVDLASTAAQLATTSRQSYSEVLEALMRASGFVSPAEVAGVRVEARHQALYEAAAILKDRVRANDFIEQSLYLAGQTSGFQIAAERLRALAEGAGE